MSRAKLFYKKNEIPKLFLNEGAKINQSFINNMVSDQIENVDKHIDYITYRLKPNKNNEKKALYRLEMAIKHLKFLIKLGASTKKLINHYNNKAINFPDQKNIINNVKNAIRSAIAQRQEILNARALEKQYKQVVSNIVNMFHYRPPRNSFNKGGNGYQEAKRHFNSLKNL